MRTRLEELRPEDKERHTRTYLRAETARCGVLSPEETREALRAELEFMRYIRETYEVDDEEDWQIDPVDMCIYEGQD
jgi:hypothetical protein